MAKLRKRGQSLAEFILCLALVSAAIVGMSIYLRRSVQARYHGGVSSLLSTLGAGSQQYEPYYIGSEMTEKTMPGSTVTTGFPESSINVTTQRSGWQAQGAPINAD